ncbi:MAG TPA: energy transducer TonB [Candidatus Udaeobacter sp.]|nr:energy transducer TonB [Candidatus Udaeobacter sp.]
MFAESFLETSWAERGRRSCTTLTSFGLQAVIIGLLLLIPLLTTVGLPSGRTVSTPISLGRRDPGPAPQIHGDRRRGMQIIPYTGRIMEPGRIPHGVQPGNDTTQVSGPTGPPDVGLGSYVGSGPSFPIPEGGTRPVIPAAPKTITKVFRTSSILQGSLIRKVEPKYPPLAISARIQGPVVLAAVISKAGTIDNLRLVSGHPMLVGAAIDAVSQWRYRPYILNGDVIEVETQITVNFLLGH